MCISESIYVKYYTPSSQKYTKKALFKFGIFPVFQTWHLYKNLLLINIASISLCLSLSTPNLHSVSYTFRHRFLFLNCKGKSTKFYMRHVWNMTHAYSVPITLSMHFKSNLICIYIYHFQIKVGCQTGKKSNCAAISFN